MKLAQFVRRAMPAFFVAMLLVATSAFAQFSASLSGTVEDPSGAVVPGASVTLTNNATQEQRTITSGGSGFYRFNELAPGSYNVQVTASGFEANTLANVVLAAESPRDLDIKLTVGKGTESVTVSADQIPDLQTADASVSSTIDSEAIERLPSVGGDPYELLRTAPGITGDSARGGTGGAVFLPNGGGPGQSNSGIYQTENQVQISAAGLPVGFNNYLIDGVSVNSLGRAGAAVVTPNVDAVSQITVVSSSFSAEDGRDAGAQIKVVTKSGSNDFHGTARFQYDEPGLNAYNAFYGPSGQLPQRVDNKQRYYGGSLGGPIVKDKLFFFFSAEAFQQLQQSFSSQFVETPDYRALLAAERPGNIANRIVAGAGAPRVAQLLTQSCTNPVNLMAPINGIPQPCQVVGDGIDLGSPYGAEGQYVPADELQSGSGLDGIPDVQYAEIQTPNHVRGRQYNGRLDFNLTPRDLIAGSVYFTKLDSDTASGTEGSRYGDDIPFKPLNSAATVLYVHTFGPSLINEIRANFTRFYDNALNDVKGSPVNFGIPFIDIQRLDTSAGAGGNDIQFGLGYSSTSPSLQVENTYELRDMVSKVFGNHTIKMGLEYRDEQNYSNYYGQTRPGYSFWGPWNFFNDTPIFEEVDANPNTGGPGETQRYLLDHYVGAFVQHDWKVSPSLTVNMGLRWEFFEPVYNKGFNVYLPEEDFLGGMPLAGADVQLHHHYYDTKFKDFSPKFGFAWTPTPDASWVVRGGFAMAYSRLPDSLFDDTLQNGPNNAAYGICCGTAGPALDGFGSPYDGGAIKYELGTSNSPFSFAPNPVLAVGTTQGIPNSNPYFGFQVYGAAPGLQNPYTYLYSLEIQKELGRNYVFTVGYQGNRTVHETRLVNQVFIYPLSQGAVSSPFGAGYYNAQSDSVANYNGLNVQLNRRFNRGVSLTGVYTWAKALDQVSNGDAANASANQTFPQNNNTEYGPADYDVQNRFVASAVWDIPTYHADSKIMKAVTGGWQVNGIFTAHTGFPFTPVTSTINGLPPFPDAPVISPVRPVSYTGGLGFNSCGNDPYVNGTDIPNRVAPGGPLPPGSALNYFDVGIPLYSGVQAPPGIGRNSFRGPCYQDLDMSIAKQFTFDAFDHTPLLRFQLNAFNALNHTNLSPFGFNSTSSTIESSQFGEAQTADAGRVLELLVRLQF